MSIVAPSTEFLTQKMEELKTQICSRIPKYHKSLWPSSEGYHDVPEDELPLLRMAMGIPSSWDVSMIPFSRFEDYSQIFRSANMCPPETFRYNFKVFDLESHNEYCYSSIGNKLIMTMGEFTVLCLINSVKDLMEALKSTHLSDFYPTSSEFTTSKWTGIEKTPPNSDRMRLYGSVMVNKYGEVDIPLELNAIITRYPGDEPQTIVKFFIHIYDRTLPKKVKL